MAVSTEVFLEATTVARLLLPLFAILYRESSMAPRLYTAPQSKVTDVNYSTPPAELQEAIMKIRDNVDATLIIKPLFNEDLNMKTKKMKLKNYNRASFYIYER